MNYEELNFLLSFNYEPLVIIALSLLVMAALLLIFLSVRSFIQKHDLEQLQKREAVLLKIKEDKDRQAYYRKVLLSNIERPNFRRLV